MANSDVNIPADLANILSTLSQYGSQVLTSNHVANGIEEDDEYIPSDNFTPSNYPLSETLPPKVVPTVVDPASITEWPAGLRCINKIASQNPQFQSAMREVSIISSSN